MKNGFIEEAPLKQEMAHYNQVIIEVINAFFIYQLMSHIPNGIKSKSCCLFWWLKPVKSVL